MRLSANGFENTFATARACAFIEPRPTLPSILSTKDQTNAQSIQLNGISGIQDHERGNPIGSQQDGQLTATDETNGSEHENGQVSFDLPLTGHPNIDPRFSPDDHGEADSTSTPLNTVASATENIAPGPPAETNTQPKPKPYFETFYGFLEDPMDALFVIEGCVRGELEAFRGTAREMARVDLRSGTVIVVPDDSVHIKRWRVQIENIPAATSAPTLTPPASKYAHLGVSKLTGIQPAFSQHTLKPNTQLMPNGLTKRTITLEASDGLKYRVISYYTPEDVFDMYAHITINGLNLEVEFFEWEEVFRRPKDDAVLLRLSNDGTVHYGHLLADTVGYEDPFLRAERNRLNLERNRQSRGAGNAACARELSKRHRSPSPDSIAIATTITASARPNKRTSNQQPQQQQRVSQIESLIDMALCGTASNAGTSWSLLPDYAGMQLYPSISPSLEQFPLWTDLLAPPYGARVDAPMPSYFPGYVSQVSPFNEYAMHQMPVYFSPLKEGEFMS
ncbi:hypothetical protein HDU98_008988 [Podochytrium sp. JEL0797]|nr:hypothetical protein HDU98_008988 [Podochytrium sp. JEL0797]